MTLLGLSPGDNSPIEIVWRKFWHLELAILMLMSHRHLEVGINNKGFIWHGESVHHRVWLPMHSLDTSAQSSMSLLSLRSFFFLSWILCCKTLPRLKQCPRSKRLKKINIWVNLKAIARIIAYTQDSFKISNGHLRLHFVKFIRGHECSKCWASNLPIGSIWTQPQY